MLKIFVAGPHEFVDQVRQNSQRPNIFIPYIATDPAQAIDLFERSGRYCNILLLGFCIDDTRAVIEALNRFSVNIIPFVSAEDLLEAYTIWTPYQVQVVKRGQEIDGIWDAVKDIQLPEVGFNEEYSPKETISRVESIENKTTPNAITAPRKVVSAFDFKGGVGKTALIVSTAKSIASLTSLKVCILDLDVTRDYGDAVKYLGLPDNAVKHTVVSWKNFPFARKADWDTVKNYLLEGWENGHLPEEAKGKLYLLPGIAGMTDSGDLSQELVIKVLEVLRRHFDIILCDLGNVLNDVVVAVMEASDEMFLVNKPSAPEMKALVNFTKNTLPLIQISRSQISLVYNQVIAGMKLKKQDIKNSNYVNFPCIAELPRDMAVELGICNDCYVPYLPKDKIPFTLELTKVLYKIYPRAIYQDLHSQSWWDKFFRKEARA